MPTRPARLIARRRPEAPRRRGPSIGTYPIALALIAAARGDAPDAAGGSGARACGGKSPSGRKSASSLLVWWARRREQALRVVTCPTRFGAFRDRHGLLWRMSSETRGGLCPYPSRRLETTALPAWRLPPSWLPSLSLAVACFRQGIDSPPTISAILPRHRSGPRSGSRRSS